jgi:hypothetical protein
MALHDVFRIDNYDFISWLVFKLVWVQNVVFYPEGRGYIEGARNQRWKRIFAFWREVIGEAKKTAN